MKPILASINNTQASNVSWNFYSLVVEYFFTLIFLHKKIDIFRSTQSSPWLYRILCQSSLLAALGSLEQISIPLAFSLTACVLNSFNKHIGCLVLLINVLLTLPGFYHCLMMPFDEERNAAQEFCNFSIGQLIRLLNKDHRCLIRTEKLDQKLVNLKSGIMFNYIYIYIYIPIF